MKTKRFLQLTHAMCEQAVLEAFDKKWFRRDYLATVEKYGGVSRAELSRAARLNDWNLRLEVVNSIALEMEQRVEDLVEGETDDLDLEPVSVFYRIDGISMKRRELLRAKLLPYQFASIPGKGQIALKRQVERWLRRKSLGIQHAVKLDVQGAYAHTKQAVVMDILRREIPGATWLLAVIKCLLAMAPGEGLLIGGYLEAWLFNLVASYMLVKVLSYAKTRRGASTPFVTRSGSYMDDLVLLGRRWADIQSAARKLTKWALAEFGLTIKTEWVRVDFLSAAEEHQRRHMTGAAKGCPGLDMAGYVMHRTYTTIRPRIFLRARRQYIRAKADVSRNGYVPVWRSYKLVSYNGYFDWTKSRAISEALKQKKLFTAAKVAIRVTAQRNAMKKVRIAE